MQDRFKELIRAIGRGKNAGRNLTQEEAYEAFSMLLNKRITPEQRGAFLMLLRVREETPEEIAGFLQASREHTNSDVATLGADLDLGCYAGKRRHLPWFFLAVMCLAQSGMRIFLHGTQEPESKRLYLKSVLNELGFPVGHTIEDAQLCMDRLGFSYMDLGTINSPLDEIIQLRAQFGLRSCANTLARMLNPSQAEHSFQGVFHRHADDKHIQAASLLKDSNVLCLRGEGGETEFNPERSVILQTVRHGEQEQHVVGNLLTHTVIKNKSLDVMDLCSVWRGVEENEYAYSAIIGTLAAMLVLTDSLVWSEAFRQAEVMWSQRNAEWPLPLKESTKQHSTLRSYAH